MGLKNKIYPKLRRLRWVRILSYYSKKIIIPGFDNIPVYDVGIFFIKGLSKRSITFRASAISFNLFMSLFPAAIFLFTLIAYIPIPNFQNILLGNIARVVPDTTYDLVRHTLEDIVGRQRGGLLSVGFFLALIFSTNGIMSLMAAFNNTYHAIETRKLLWQYIISIFLVVVLALTSIIIVSLIFFGSDWLRLIVSEYNMHKVVFYNIFYFTKWIIITVSLFFIISLIFYLAPAKKTRFRFISAGATLATALFVLSSVLFNYFINNFSQYNKLYGSIGTLLIIMLWIYVNAIVLLIGFELNASIKQAGMEKKQLLLG